MMLRFNNDYNRSAHPAVLAALAQTAGESYCGYGLDEYCENGAQEIKKYLGGADVDIHFLIGGTQMNYTAIAAALRPYQSVIAADTAHINVHETGAVENTGHKINVRKGVNGKLTAAEIAAEAESYVQSGIKEHITQPKLVFISLPTEYGTTYTKAELTEINAVCKKYGLYLYIDGARLGYGLAAADCDLTLADLAALADIFYIGGTKCGALFGEAAVIINPALKSDFRSYMKQNGAMLAKGWLLGLQFYTLFKDGLYFDITRCAVDSAMKLKDAFIRRGIPFYIDSSTNQQFVILDAAQMEKLSAKYAFEYECALNGGRHVVRFCTSWSTLPEETDALMRDILAL